MQFFINVNSVFVFTVVGCYSNTVFKFSDHNVNKIYNDVTIILIFDTFEGCATSCLRVTDCAAVNYDMAAKTCHYWHVTSQFSVISSAGLSNRMVLMDMDDWKLVMSRDPCADKPCGSYELCVPNGSSYICEAFCACCHLSVQDYCAYSDCIVYPSSFDTTSYPADLNLLSNGGWMPDSGDDFPFILYYLEKTPFLVKGVVTRGDESRQGWVTKYYLEVSSDCDTYTSVNVAGGNTDPVHSVIGYIDPPVMPKCLVIVPLEYVNVLSMRVDLVGCTP